MQTIKRILADAGEECEVDVETLHETLSKLPAEIYLELYHKMQDKVEKQNQSVKVEIDFKEIQKAAREYQMKTGKNAFAL